MNHWIDPDRRGLYDHPHAPPPRPAHHAANDHGSRLARLEEHINFQAWNQRRAETELRMMADDLADGMTVLSSRVLVIEQSDKSRKHMHKTIRLWGTSASAFVRYAVAGALGLLLLTGKASLETVKFLMGLLGLPAG